MWAPGGSELGECALARVFEGASDTGGAEHDAAEIAGNDEDTNEIRMSQLLEEPHPGAAYLAVVAGLFDNAVVQVADAAGPAVVARFVVLPAASPDDLLRLVKGRGGRRQREKSRALFGDGELGGGGDLGHGTMVPES